jgi:hypothetical protein|nr:MAG TPA: Organic solute transporter subunit beta protein [Caudoviricetes sp.]
MYAISIVAMLVIAFLVGRTIGATSNKKKSKPEDEAPDIEQNDRKWEINEERLNKLRAEITQALKEKGVYRFDSKTDKGYEGLYLNDGELYELLKPFLRKGYFVKSHTDRFIHLNKYFKVSKHRGSYSEIWGVTEADLEHVL